MVPLRIKMSLFFIPAIVIGLFETIRHTLLENILPMELGNWITAFVDAGAIALVARGLFLAYANTEHQLSQERASRAVLEERERLGRVLHDQIAQSIFYSGVQVSSAKTKIQQMKYREAEQNLTDVLLSLREIDENVRQAIFNLKQDIVEGAHFEERIRSSLEKTLSKKNMSWSFESSGNNVTFSPTEQVQLFGIFQEAITNVVKHSQATHVSVQLHVEDTDHQHWALTIEDDGIGFNRETIRDGSYGMEIMENRARDIKAELRVKSEPGRTSIQVRR